MQLDATGVRPGGIVARSSDQVTAIQRRRSNPDPDVAHDADTSAPVEGSTVHTDTEPPPRIKLATYAYPPDTAIPWGSVNDESLNVVHDDSVGGVPDTVHTDTEPPPAFATYAYPPDTAIPRGSLNPDPDVVHDASAPVEGSTRHTDTPPPKLVTYAYPPDTAIP